MLARTKVYSACISVESFGAHGNWQYGDDARGHVIMELDIV